MNSIAKDIIKKLQILDSDRKNWESHWQQLADYIMPRRGDFSVKTTVKGRKKQGHIFDSTAPKSCENLASALIGYTCNPTTQWFSLEATNPELTQEPEIKKYLDIAITTMYSVFTRPESNFYPQMHELFIDLCTFGTACINIEEFNDECPVRFQTIPLNEIFIQENEYGVIDRVYRKYTQSIANILARFSDSIDPETLRYLEEASRRNDTEEMDLIHAVFPENTNDPRRFGSYYVLVSKAAIISQSRYFENPYVVCRWSKMAGETYGRSQGMTALPDIISLNQITQTILLAGQKAVDPPMIIYDDNKDVRIDTSPGAVICLRRDPMSGGNELKPLQFASDFNTGLTLAQQRQQSIQQIFMIDMLMDDKRAEMTATEAVQREQARMRVMAPQLGRLHTELFSLLIKRVYNILKRSQFIPPIPEEFADRGLNISYVSPLAKSQKMMLGSQMQNALQQLLPLMQFDQNILQIINMQELARYIVDIYDMPASVIRTDEEIQQIAQQAQEQQAQEQQMAGMDQLKTGSEAMRNINDVMLSQREGGLPLG